MTAKGEKKRKERRKRIRYAFGSVTIAFEKLEIK